MSDVPAIAVRDLRYAYKKHQALAGVSFEVAARSIHGFVGPNGAGKTTTLKILATLLEPQQGSVKIFGLDVKRDRKQVRGKIGFMPDHFSMYRQMTVFEYLDFFGAAYGLTVATRSSVIDDVLALTDMDGRRNDLIKGLSRGMQQRVSLARVLVHDPDLLFLDEPASGLDPRARIELMEILQELRRMGKTIFISSHILSELGDLCDSFTILDRGESRYTGPLEGLTHEAGGHAVYRLGLQAKSPEMAAALEALPGVISVVADAERPEYQVTFNEEETDSNAVLSAVISAGGLVRSFRTDSAELQRAFMNLTTPGVRD
jgi:ABC-2 type transport system ATP-binding protein